MLVFWRLLPATIAIGFAVIVFFLSLSLLQFNQIRSELDRERVAILANRTAEPFEEALRIGLPLSSVRNAGTILQRALQIDPAISAIHVLLPNGETAASARRDLNAPDISLLAHGTLGHESADWSGDTGTWYFSGARVFNAAGDVAGGVMIVYPSSEGAVRSWAMAAQLIAGGLLALLIAVPVVALVLRVALRRELKQFDGVVKDIEDHERSSWRVCAARPVPTTAPMHGLLVSAQEMYHIAASGKNGRRPADGQNAMEPQLDVSGLRRRLTSVLTALIIFLVAVFSAITLSAFDRSVAPQLESRTRLIGALIQSEMQRTLQLGIPITALGGLETYLDEALRDLPEVRRIAIVADDGTAIAEVALDEAPSLIAGTSLGDRIGIRSTRFELPVLAGNDVVGSIIIDGAPQFAETRLRDVILDVAILAMAILLIGVEITLAAVALLIWKPYASVLAVLVEQSRGNFRHLIPEQGLPILRRLAMRLNDRVLHLHGTAAARPGRMPGSTALSAEHIRASEPGDIRLPLFLFAAGTEVTASFLPLLASFAARPAQIPAEAAAAAPLVLYLLGIAFLAPLAARTARRYGPLRVFICCIPSAAAALVVMATADSLLGVTLARGAIAIFYAFATIACHDYAMRARASGSGGTATTAFVGTILAGTFCGSVIGGVIATRLGYPSAVLTGCIFVSLAAIAARAMMSGDAGRPAPAVEGSPMPRPVRGETIRFVGLASGIALPTSLVTAVFLWYLLPLLLADEGLRVADIARMIMSYYLAGIIFGPVFASFCATAANARLCAIAGALVSGLSLLSLGIWSGLGALTITIGVVGLGHAMIRSPLLFLAVEYAGTSRRLMDALRVTERLGALTGLVFAVALARRSDMSSTPILLGTLAVFGALIFAATTTPAIARRRAS